MVSRASAVGCHPSREGALPAKEEVDPRALLLVVVRLACLRDRWHVHAEGGLAVSLARGYVTLLQPMADLELTRTTGDRRLYSLEGVGTLRLQGFASRTATAEAAGTSWRFARHRFWQRLIEATDAAGTAVGEFEPRSLRRGGTLRWAGREFALRPASSWRERYALADGDRELALLDGKGWGRRPVKVTVDESGAVEPGLLLFAAFVVRGLAEDAGGAAAAGAATAATGG